MLRPLLCAIGFLTRAWLPPLEFSEQEVARSAGYFAWVGALLAALLWAGARITLPFGDRLGALGVVALWAYATGGLHLDGIADAADGLSGGRLRTPRQPRTIPRRFSSPERSSSRLVHVWSRRARSCPARRIRSRSSGCVR